MKGKVRTVLGDIEPAEVGMTSMHEHLFIDFTVVFQPPEEATAKARAYEPVSLSNLGRIRYDRSAALPTCCCSMRTRRSRRWVTSREWAEARSWTSRLSGSGATR